MGARPLLGGVMRTTRTDSLHSRDAAKREARFRQPSAGNWDCHSWATRVHSIAWSAASGNSSALVTSRRAIMVRTNRLAEYAAARLGTVSLSGRYSSSGDGWRAFNDVWNKSSS